jgi:hypothetical protein
MTDRRTRSAIAAYICLAFAAMIGTPAGAQDAPRCTGESLGQASCFSNRLCECIYDRGGAITGTPPGYRWDCGNLRPNCGEAANPPATLNEYKGPYPLAIGIGR